MNRSMYRETCYLRIDPFYLYFIWFVLFVKLCFYSDLQQSTEIDFVLQLQTFHEISQKNSGKKSIIVLPRKSSEIFGKCSIAIKLFTRREIAYVRALRRSRVQGPHPVTSGVCFSVVPGSNPRSRFVNSQLVCFLPVGIFNYVMFI